MKFEKDAVVVEAITFDELVAHGVAYYEANAIVLTNGMPWSFKYAGQNISHENDDCYLIPTFEGTVKMGRGDMLITGIEGEIYLCKKDVFEATYQRAAMAHVEAAGGDKAPRVTPADVQAAIVGETYTVLPSGRVTVCELTLKNGFTVRGESAVVFIENFDAEIGQAVARKKAVDQVWQLMGYALRDRVHEEQTQKEHPSSGFFS